MDAATLRTTTDAIEKNMQWTTELEGGRLTQKVVGIDGFESSIVAGPDIAFASGNEDAYAPVFPAIPGFSTLNTSMLDESALSLLDTFCTAITTGADADACMEKGHLYSLVLFLYDLDQKDGPLFSSYVLGEPFKNDEVFQCPVRFYYASNDKKEQPVAAGLPIPQDAVPVDVKTGTVYEPSLDVYLYLVKEDSYWKIDQIAYDTVE